MNDDDYRVYFIHLPADIRGMIQIAPDGFASIFINDALSFVEQQKVFCHELRHLRRGDMYSTRSIRSVEAKQRRNRT